MAVRIHNAEGEIQQSHERNDVINFRIINDDRVRATQEFIELVEALYKAELGI